MINEQNAIEGQRKEVNVESYSVVTKLGQLLKDLDFPAQKARFYSLSGCQKTLKTREIS